jgi:hypothetical protein
LDLLIKTLDCVSTWTMDLVWTLLMVFISTLSPVSLSQRSHKQYLRKLIIMDYLVLTWFIYLGFLDPDLQNILLGLIRFFIFMSFGFPEPGFLAGSLLQLLLFITVKIPNFIVNCSLTLDFLTFDFLILERPHSRNLFWAI